MLLERLLYIFQTKVKKPKSCRYVHNLDLMGANSGQKVVTLTLDQVLEVGTPSAVLTVSPNHKEMTGSKSSPQLQGAWGERTVFTPVTTPEMKGL